MIEIEYRLLYHHLYSYLFHLAYIEAAQRDKIKFHLARPIGHYRSSLFDNAMQKTGLAK